MNLHEYQAKEIFTKYGIPVPEGRLAESPEAARAAAKALGGRVVVKAQVHAGGRGKAGGVKLVENADAAEEAAKKSGNPAGYQADRSGRHAGEFGLG